MCGRKEAAMVSRLIDRANGAPGNQKSFVMEKLSRFAGALLMFAGFLASTPYAHAEVVTLICTCNIDGVECGPTATVDVDFQAKTVCFIWSVATPPCLLYPAQIADRYITFNGNVLDRQTGNIKWLTGSGKCQKSGKPVL
jgi:hypothetical protein